MESKLPNPVRLACIRPAASVHPEPGSNSPLYNVLFVPDSIFKTQNRNLLFRLGVRRLALPPYSSSLRLYLLQYSYTLKIDSAVSYCFTVTGSALKHSPAALFDYLLVFIRTFFLASRFGLYSIAVKRLLFCFGYRKSLSIFFDPWWACLIWDCKGKNLFRFCKTYLN